MAKKPTLKETIQLQEVANNNLRAANADCMQRLHVAIENNVRLEDQVKDADLAYSNLQQEAQDIRKQLLDAQTTIRGITAQHFIDLRNAKLASDARKVAWILFDVAFGFAVAYLIWS